MANNSNCGVGVAYNAKVGGKIQDLTVKEIELYLLSEYKPERDNTEDYSNNLNVIAVGRM